MNRRLIKLNTSLGAVIPKGIIEHFGLKVGDVIDFRIDGENIKAIPIHGDTK